MLDAAVGPNRVLPLPQFARELHRHRPPAELCAAAHGTAQPGGKALPYGAKRPCRAPRRRREHAVPLGLHLGQVPFQFGCTGNRLAGLGLDQLPAGFDLLSSRAKTRGLVLGS
jgi:hypothetical protein